MGLVESLCIWFYPSRRGPLLINEKKLEEKSSAKKKNPRVLEGKERSPSSSSLEYLAHLLLNPFLPCSLGLRDDYCPAILNQS